ncbi:vacuolar protein sorting-associated protein 4-like [Haemaphysalis longicornis]
MAAERYSVSAFQTLLEKANRLATTAEQHDRDKKLPQAFAQYKQTLQTYLTVIEDMLFTCIHFQERNEDLLREITPNDKYRKPTHPQPDRSKQDVDALDFEGSSNLNRLPGVLSITPDKPVKWSDVVGHETPKFILKLAILDRCPIKHPIMFTGKRQSIKSILLFGPSGCGKSYLTKAMIGAAKDWVCIDVNMASLIRDAPQGMEDMYVKSLFKAARLAGWCLVLLQDVHELFKPCEKPSDEQRQQKLRENIAKEVKFINENLTYEVTICVATTNAPKLVDSFFVGAFQKRIFIPMPRPEERMRIFKQHVGKAPHTITDDQWIEVADRTAGFCGEDILSVVMQTFKESGELTFAEVSGALEHFKPKNTPEDIEECFKFKKEHAATSA